MRDGSISATALFADSDDDVYLPQTPDNRIRFSTSAQQEVK